MEILVFDTSYVQDRKEKNIGKKNFLFSFSGTFSVWLCSCWRSHFCIFHFHSLLDAGCRIGCFQPVFYLVLSGSETGWEKVFGRAWTGSAFGRLLLLLAGFVDPWLLQRCQQCDPEDQSGLRRQFLNTLEASSGGTVLFFMVLIFIITGILGAFMVKEQKWLPVLAVFFPVFAITAAAAEGREVCGFICF